MNGHPATIPDAPQLGIIGGAAWVCVSAQDGQQSYGKPARQYRFLNLGAGPQEVRVQIGLDAVNAPRYTGALVSTDGKLHVLPETESATLLAVLAQLTGLVPTIPIAPEATATIE